MRPFCHPTFLETSFQCEFVNRALDGLYNPSDLDLRHSSISPYAFLQLLLRESADSKDNDRNLKVRVNSLCWTDTPLPSPWVIRHCGRSCLLRN
jgi:hypothetical protein